MSDTWRVAARLDELDEDYPTGIVLEEMQIALYLVDGEAYATADICSHGYAKLSGGFIENGEVLCPLHNGRFDVKTGAATCAPAAEPIATYPARIDDGVVLVKLPIRG